jgi:hypothetical protein
MNSSARSTKLIFALLIAALFSCTPDQPQTFPPARPTISARAPAATAAAVEVETSPCSAVATNSVQFAASAQPPDVAPGAGEEVEDVDQGEPEPIPVDPEGRPFEVGELPLAPPPGAQDEPQQDDVAVFGSPKTILLPFPQTYMTAEPNVAVKGNRVFMTWNRMAATSSDLGVGHQYLFPIGTNQSSGDITAGGFCCDQLAHYVERYDLWLWILQYEPANNRNWIRLAVAHGQEGFDKHIYDEIDFTPQDAGLPTGLTYDQAKIGTSSENLFVSINVVNTDNKVKSSVVIRVPLAQLANSEPIRPTCLHPKDPQGTTKDSLMPVRLAGDTMYLATHINSTTLAVWRWPDSQSRPTYQLVRQPAANGGYVSYPGHWVPEGDSWRAIDYSCPRTNAAASTDWCSRPGRGGGSANDERITTGWLANGRIGFAWNARQDPEHGFPYPWVWSIVIDESRLANCAAGGCIVEYPYLALDNTAVQYPAIAPNAAGDLGGVVLLGGGELDLTCSVIVHDSLTDPASRWDRWNAVESNRAPGETSGDYLGIWPNGGNDRSWTAGCMTMTTGAAPVAVHFVRFGRKFNEP